MLNVAEINNTIDELEHGSTTFDTCNKLASLYIVREHIGKRDMVEQEYQDILPQYRRYVAIKKQYQKGELSEKSVEDSINLVCRELQEFIQTMYSCTDMEVERNAIFTMVEQLQKIF